MNVALDSAEHVLVRQVAEVVAEEIREQVVRDLSQNPVLWSKRTAAYMIGGGAGPLERPVRGGPDS